MNIQNPPYKILGLIAVLLLAAILPMPYGYYTFVKILTCGCAGLNFYQLWQTCDKGVWLYVWGAIAIIFNPLIPIAMQKEAWMIADGLAGLVFAYAAYKLFNQQKSPN